MNGDEWTVIGEAGTVTVTASEAATGAAQSNGGPSLDADSVTGVTGWSAKPEGWCRGDECIPHRTDSAPDDGAWSLSAVADALGVAVAENRVHRVAAIGHRRTAAASLTSGIAPDITLTAVDGSRRNLFDERDGKTMVVAFSSWCGCRYDLPGWQDLENELSDTGFGVVAVAIDESADDVVEWARGIDYPVLVDTDRTFADAYGLVNVPAVIWTDENRNVVHAPTAEFSSDVFTEVHGVESRPHLDAVRKWVREGTAPDDDWTPAGRARPAAALNDDQRQARVEFRVALTLLRMGHKDAAESHLSRADELAPDDFTIWRAAMKLRGEDTFGPEFYERYTDWRERYPA